MPHDAPGALSHIRVLDLSRVFAGPWCTQMLADLGADVIKVEQPSGGDDVRHMGAALRSDDGEDTGERASFLAMNRGKRSIAIDLANPSGQALVRRLVAQSDVVVENFKTGTLARWGLDYASLATAHARLVYCSITGFGQTGPRRMEPGYDAIFQAMSGLMSVTGSSVEVPGSEPCLVGYSSSDINAGLYASVAILAALNYRDTVSGRGQHIDLGLYDTQIASMSHLVVNHLLSGQAPVRSGSASQINAPWKAFRCEDGPLMVTVGNNRQFSALAAALGQPELATDPRFLTNGSRIAHKTELYAILDVAFAHLDLASVHAALSGHGVPCAPVHSLPEALADPQAQARDVVITMDHPMRGDLPLLGNPIRMSETPPAYALPPPMLDEHRDYVLGRRLGLSRREIDEAERTGAFG